MKALKLRVAGGWITGEAPPGMPDGDVEVCLAEPDEEMTPDELERLNQALDAGWRSVQAGRFRPATEAIQALRARR